MAFYICISSIVSYWYVFCSIINQCTMNRTQLLRRSKIINFNDSSSEKRLVEIINNNMEI